MYCAPADYPPVLPDRWPPYRVATAWEAEEREDEFNEAYEHECWEDD